jgi:hypothetical protein
MRSRLQFESTAPLREFDALEQVELRVPNATAYSARALQACLAYNYVGYRTAEALTTMYSGNETAWRESSNRTFLNDTLTVRTSSNAMLLNDMDDL